MANEHNSVRDSSGKFVVGHPGVNAGRRRNSYAEEYLAAIRAAVSLQDMQMIAERAMMQARRGDYQARKWISEYIIGQPIERQPAERAAIDEAILGALGELWGKREPDATPIAYGDKDGA